MRFLLGCSFQNGRSKRSGKGIACTKSESLPDAAVFDNGNVVAVYAAFLGHIGQNQIFEPVVLFKAEAEIVRAAADFQHRFERFQLVGIKFEDIGFRQQCFNRLLVVIFLPDINVKELKGFSGAQSIKSKIVLRE